MSEPEKTTRVVQTIDQPVEIELVRGARGQYRWSISVKAESPDEALRVVQALDLELNRSYGETVAQVQPSVGSVPTRSKDSSAGLPRSPHQTVKYWGGSSAGEGGERV